MRMPCGGVVERGALRQADDAVLGRAVGGSAGTADQPGERRAVDDRAAALRAHVTRLVLHAGPHAAQVDRGDAVEVLGRLVRRVARRDHDPRVIERHVEAAELPDGALDEGGDLLLVRDLAGDAERLPAADSQLVGGGTQRLLVGVGEDDGGAGLGEGPSGGETHSGAGAGDDGDLAVEVVGRVHASPLVL